MAVWIHPVSTHSARHNMTQLDTTETSSLNVIK